MLWNSPGTIILIAVFLAGAVLFATGTAMLRRQRLRVQPMPAAAEPPDPYARIEELLAAADAPSIRELERMRDSDASPEIRDAADAALMVIGSR